jgi:hypothetical protein
MTGCARENTFDLKLQYMAFNAKDCTRFFAAWEAMPITMADIELMLRPTTRGASRADKMDDHDSSPRFNHRSRL